jgi:hypothetical protein
VDVTDSLVVAYAAEQQHVGTETSCNLCGVHVD